MSKAGDVFENPVTGEFGYVRIGTDETNGEFIVSDLRLRPGAAAIGPHIHPQADERFTAVTGKLGYLLGDQKLILEAGESMDIPRGTVHDFWNAGEEDARVVVEIRPGARMELMIRTMFALAHEGKTNEKGMPGLLQMALISREFDDVLQVMSPPLAVQRVLFALLTPLARLLGYQAIYPHHDKIRMGTTEVEPLPEGMLVPAV
jgi:quercetin dioxygenase-like cupin family protein